MPSIHIVPIFILVNCVTVRAEIRSFSVKTPHNAVTHSGSLTGAQSGSRWYLISRSGSTSFAFGKDPRSLFQAKVSSDLGRSMPFILIPLSLTVKAERRLQLTATRRAGTRW